MTAIEKEVLQSGLCAACDCAGFSPVLNYEFKNTATLKQVIVTDASVFGTGDALKKVLVHVIDKNGKEKHDSIGTAAGVVTINVATLDYSNLSVLATVISTTGCKADFGVYNIGTVDNKGSIQNISKAGKRN